MRWDVGVGSGMGADMPPRWLNWLIVVFWLATTGWLFWHDLWPRWRPGEPPLFHVDLVEEVQKSNRLPTYWTVERQGKGQLKPHPVFRARTEVAYDKDQDAYTLHANLDVPSGYRRVDVARILRIKSIASAYRVNRSGQLLSLGAEVQGEVSLRLEQFLLGNLFPEQDNSTSEKIALVIRGEVRDHQFFAQCSVTADSLQKPMQFDLPPTDVSYTGSVLMPLHPLNHIRGLRLGQSWRQPVVDPIQDAFDSLPGFSGGVRWFNARVLPQLEVLNMEDNQTKCLVIEYTNDENDPMGRTWVDQDTENVLQQEAILEDGRWIMKRELQRRSRVRHLGAGND